MRPISVRAAGFTLIELMITVALLGILAALGVPRLQAWASASKAKGAAEFYLEGLRTARAQAVRHNAATRIVFSPNAQNGQPDWQVDLCFPTAALPCNDLSGSWSTPAQPALGDPEGAAGYLSQRGLAQTLAPATVLTVTLNPAGTSAVYFTATGWSDPNIAQRTNRIDLSPAGSSDFPPAAIVVTLAGVASRCEPGRPPGDSRACPP